ncbi:unnamed protein product [Discula destructiva]
MSNKLRFEVPVFHSTSADSIIHLGLGLGTARLELNALHSYPQGGCTPSQTTYHESITSASSSATPLRIMIRPRGPPDDDSPDFVYSQTEFDEHMERGVLEWKESNVLSVERGDGFVLGMLREKSLDDDHTGAPRLVVDVERCSHLVRLAAPYPCVFHRAFDDVLGSGGSTVEEALSDIARCGFTGLLTSGGPGRAIDNVDTLARIIRAAAPASRLREVIVGGGVRSANVRELAAALLPRGRRSEEAAGLEVWFHSSCVTERSAGPSGSQLVDEEELRLIAEYVKVVS